MARGPSRQPSWTQAKPPSVTRRLKANAAGPSRSSNWPGRPGSSRSRERKRWPPKRRVQTSASLVGAIWTSAGNRPRPGSPSARAASQAPKPRPALTTWPSSRSAAPAWTSRTVGGSASNASPSARGNSPGRSRRHVSRRLAIGRPASSARISSSPTTPTQISAPVRSRRPSSSARSTAEAGAEGMSGPLSPSASSDQRASRGAPSAPMPSAVTAMPPRRAPNRASRAAIGRSAGASGRSEPSSRNRTAHAASPMSRVRMAGSTLARNSPSSRAAVGSMSRSGVSASAASRRPSPGRLTHPAPIHARRVVQAPPLKHRTGWPACESMARVTDSAGRLRGRRDHRRRSPHLAPAGGQPRQRRAAERWGGAGGRDREHAARPRQPVQRRGEAGDVVAGVGKVDPVRAGFDDRLRQCKGRALERSCGVDHRPGPQRHDRPWLVAVDRGRADCGLGGRGQPCPQRLQRLGRSGGQHQIELRPRREARRQTGAEHAGRADQHHAPAWRPLVHKVSPPASPASCRGWRRPSGRSSPRRRCRCRRRWFRGA